MKEKILEFYCGDEQKELKKLVYPIMTRFGGISQKDHDDFYSLAAMTLWQAAESYDEKKGIPFSKYLECCVQKQFCTMMRKRNAKKRVPECLSDSLESMISEVGMTRMETLASDFDLEKLVIERLEGDSEDGVDAFLASLPKPRRQIVELRMENMAAGEIREKLSLTGEQYAAHVRAIRRKRKRGIFQVKKVQSVEKRKLM